MVIIYSSQKMFYLDLSTPASQVAQWVKNLPAKQKKQDGEGDGSICGFGRSPGGEPATHSSILAWRIPWTEEPAGLQALGLQTVEHN